MEIWYGNTRRVRTNEIRWENGLYHCMMDTPDWCDFVWFVEDE